MNALSQVLWESQRGEPVLARVAVAGDFLPAGSITPPADGWRGGARKLARLFSDIEASFVNLECSLDVGRLPARRLNGLGQIVSAPSASLEYLAAIRCVAAGIANNHIYDFAAAGVDSTRRGLASQGMAPLGAVESLRAAPDVFVWQGPENIRVGFWAAARASADLATRNRAGVEPATVSRASQAVALLKSRGARFCIALLHAGCLRTNRADPADVNLADEIANCGFGVVACSHSHRTSGARAINISGATPSFSFYGLGSIVSGFVACPEEREGLIVVCGLHSDGALAQLEVRPVLLAADGFAGLPSPDEAPIILERFCALSREIENGSAAELFYRDMSHGLAHLYWRDVSAAFRASGFRGLVRKASRIRMRHVRRAVHGMLG